jgi:DNA repair exonuclease SbcCD ATPase subunit
LDEAKEQKKELEKTLLELKQAKEDLAKAQKAREEAEKIFNDRSKTANEKVKAFEAAMSNAPVHTDTTGVTTDDLCARAKANGSDPAVIAALCGK